MIFMSKYFDVSLDNLVLGNQMEEISETEDCFRSFIFCIDCDLFDWFLCNWLLFWTFFIPDNALELGCNCNFTYGKT